MHTAVPVSDLLYQLGDIPAYCARLQPAPGTATEADVVTVHDRESRLCELVDGVLVEKTILGQSTVAQNSLAWYHKKVSGSESFLPHKEYHS